jgi:hypothetical protein
MNAEPLFAVVGRSEGYPTLYHMNQPRERAERLRVRREALTGQPCFVVPMVAWHADPAAALRWAEAARTEG